MDDFDLIETPENVELERRLAGIGSRFMAGLVDMSLIVAVWLVLVLVVSLLVWVSSFNYADYERAAGPWVLAVFLVLAFVMYWGYFVLAELYINGQSPGKIAMKIRVVKQDGAPITFIDIAIRNLLRVVDGMPGILYCVGGITMFCTKRAQRLGDLAAGTVVVMEQVPDYSARADRRVAAPWEREASPEALRATGLRPQEYRVLVNFWLRRGQLTFDAQARLLPQIVLPILRRAGQMPADESMKTMLHCVEVLVHKAEVAERAGRRAARAAEVPAPGAPPREPPT
jgi:uncharacterized RDD family membrane protein YckC